MLHRLSFSSTRELACRTTDDADTTDHCSSMGSQHDRLSRCILRAIQILHNRHQQIKFSRDFWPDIVPLVMVSQAKGACDCTRPNVVVFTLFCLIASEFLVRRQVEDIVLIQRLFKVKKILSYQ